MSRFFPGRDVDPARLGGRHIFFDVVDEYAAQARNPAVAAVGRRCRTPVAVAVMGRRGVGRATVAAALAAAGVAVTGDAQSAEVRVVVAAETLKPEDRVLLAAQPVPSLVVLNKADLAGAEPGGPLAAAGRRAAELSAAVGLPAVPMIAHLAAVDVGDDEVAALQALVTTPADLTSCDAFVESEHPLPAETRRRLLHALDRFGLAHAVLAVADGAPPEAVARRLRTLSQVDRVLEQVVAVAAPVRYRRVRAMLKELRLLAAQSGDDELDAFLNGDDVVLAVMAAAVDVVQASGITVDRGDDPGTHARRAVQWRRYADGPVSALHHRCASDIARGSLRLLARAW